MRSRRSLVQSCIRGARHSGVVAVPELELGALPAGPLRGQAVCTESNRWDSVSFVVISSAHLPLCLVVSGGDL